MQLRDGTPVWVALGHEAVRTVLSDPRFSRAASTTPGAPTIMPAVDQPDTMVSMDPPEHTRLRRLVAAAFTTRGIERRRPRIQEIADGLLDVVAAQGPPADLLARFAFPLPIAVLCDLLGMPYEDVDRVREWSKITQSIDVHPGEAVAAAAQELGVCVEGLVAAKRDRPGDDLLTSLIQARDRDDSLTEAELVRQTIGILIGGHDTTVNQLAVSSGTMAATSNRTSARPRSISERRTLTSNCHAVLRSVMSVREVQLGLGHPGRQLVRPPGQTRTRSREEAEDAGDPLAPTRSSPIARSRRSAPVVVGGPRPTPHA